MTHYKSSIATVEEFCEKYPHLVCDMLSKHPMGVRAMRLAVEFHEIQKHFYSNAQHQFEKHSEE